MINFIINIKDSVKNLKEAKKQAAIDIDLQNRIDRLENHKTFSNLTKIDQQYIKEIIFS